MDLGLKGRVALITGGRRGIGRAIATALAEEGADIALCARGTAGLEAAVAEFRQLGIRVFGQLADMTEATAVQRFVDDAALGLGRVDILVNNVGGSKGTGLVDSTDEEWLGTFDLNLFHAVRASRAAVPYMRQQPARASEAVRDLARGRQHRRLTALIALAWLSCRACLWPPTLLPRS